jgi:4-diphosphocytidyl-2-C-methyl-D-erythritol kinase
MRSRFRRSMITLRAPAKINLGLRVLRRRSDGFHDVDTLYVAINWCDRLTFRSTRGLQMSCDDDNLPTDGRNLCLAAAMALRQHCKVEAGVHIHLEKRIPYGAGLGGGSSDAAATLMGLCKLWGVDPGESVLLSLASELGSDIPFFLGSGPAFGSGRGCDLEIWRGRPAFPFYVSVLAPRLHVSTSDAYRTVTPAGENVTTIREVVSSFNPEKWVQELLNDFETPVFQSYPELERLKRGMYDNGALYALMSGSGAAVFGLFDDESAATRAAEALESSDERRWVGRASW